MVDLKGKDRGNISLPPKLLSPDFKEDVDLEEEPMILNLQIAMYEARVNDLQHRVQRLELRNEKLMQTSREAHEHLKLKNIETEQIIVDLHNDIKLVTIRYDELKNKYDDIEKIRDAEKSKHVKNVNTIEQRFKQTEHKLQEEIQAIERKITEIEAFKAISDDLRLKYEEQEKLITQREENVEQFLNQIKYKSKIHKENLRKEAYKKVVEVSEQFQRELTDTVPLNVQKIMRENIMLENELFLLWNDYNHMQEKQYDCEYQIEEFGDRLKESKYNLKQRLITKKLHSLLINKLRRTHEIVKNKLSNSFQTPDHFEKTHLRLVEDLNNPEILNHDFRKRKLEVLLHQERVSLNSINRFKSKTESTLKKCSNALLKIKKAVDSALLVKKLHTDEEFKRMNLESFTSHLLGIIENCEAEKSISDLESIATVEEPSNIYCVGDLGFEPEPIEIFKTVDKESKTKSKDSSLKALKELEQFIKSAEKDQESLSTSLSFSYVIPDADVTSESEEIINDLGKQEIMVQSDVSYEYEHEYEDSEFDYVDYTYE